MEEIRKESEDIAPQLNSLAKRQDFFQSVNRQSSKGGPEDVLNQQRQLTDSELDYDEIKKIYKNKRIAQNIIDIPAEDATRSWLKFIVEDDNKEQYSESIFNEHKTLGTQKRIQEMIEYERLSGDGFISIGLQTSGSDVSQPVERENIEKILFLQAFSRNYVNDGEIEEDVFAENFGEFASYSVPIIGDESEDRVVHPDRLCHLQTRTVEGEMWGIPLFQSIYDALTILDSTAWSLGQIAYAAVFKVLKLAGLDVENMEEWKDYSSVFEAEFNTSTLGLIGKDDELRHEGPGNKLPNLHDLVKFVWEYLAGCARMPRSHILGQQQGTITGGQYDSLNYYMRISAMQENYLRPILRKITNYIISAKGNDIPNDLKYKIKFNSLWGVDDETDMKIRRKQAEIDEIYVRNEVISPQEMYDMRFKDETLNKSDVEQVFDSATFMQEYKDAYENVSEEELMHIYRSFCDFHNYKSA